MVKPNTKTFPVLKCSKKTNAKNRQVQDASNVLATYDLCPAAAGRRRLLLIRNRDGGGGGGGRGGGGG